MCVFFYLSRFGFIRIRFFSLLQAVLTVISTMCIAYVSTAAAGILHDNAFRSVLHAPQSFVLISIGIGFSIFTIIRRFFLACEKKVNQHVYVCE